MCAEIEKEPNKWRAGRVQCRKSTFSDKKSFQAFLLDALGPRRRLSAATVHQNGFAGPQCPCRCPRWSRIFPLEVCSVITRVRALGLMRVRQVGALHMDIRLVSLECIGVVVMFCAVHIRHGKKRKTVSHKLLTLSADFRAFTPKEARDHVYSCVMWGKVRKTANRLVCVFFTATNSFSVLNTLKSSVILRRRESGQNIFL